MAGPSSLTRRDLLLFIPFVATVAYGLPVYLMEGGQKIAFYEALLRGEDRLYLAAIDNLKIVFGVASCTRAAGSLGAWDIIAIGSTDVVLCQVKMNAWPSAVELEALRSFLAPANARKLLHRWRDCQRQPDVRGWCDPDRRGHGVNAPGLLPRERWSSERPRPSVSCPAETMARCTAHGLSTVRLTSRMPEPSAVVGSALMGAASGSVVGRGSPFEGGLLAAVPMAIGTVDHPVEVRAGHPKLSTDLGEQSLAEFYVPLGEHHRDGPQPV